MKPLNAIEIKNLTYQYPDSTKAVDQVSFQIPVGKKVAILGPNGAGKSTLLHHLNGIKTPSDGSIRIMGTLLTKKTVRSIRRQVGIVFQDPDDQVFSSTVWEDVQFGPRNLKMPEDEIEGICQVALGSVGMLEYKDKPPYHLSFGQKKRVAIAGILAMKPDIVILDEPMSYLDPQGQDEVASLLQGLNYMGKTIIVSTHDVDFASSWADIIMIMKEGKLLTMGGTELLVEEKWIKEANLHLPRYARMFRMLPQFVDRKLPKNEQEAMRAIYEYLYEMEHKISKA